jgi:hypothetical protein
MGLGQGGVQQAVVCLTRIFGPALAHALPRRCKTRLWQASARARPTVSCRLDSLRPFLRRGLQAAVQRPSCPPAPPHSAHAAPPPRSRRPHPALRDEQAVQPGACAAALACRAVPHPFHVHSAWPATPLTSAHPPLDRLPSTLTPCCARAGWRCAACRPPPTPRRPPTAALRAARRRRRSRRPRQRAPRSSARQVRGALLGGARGGGPAVQPRSLPHTPSLCPFHPVPPPAATRHPTLPPLPPPPPHPHHTPRPHHTPGHQSASTSRM